MIDTTNMTYEQWDAARRATFTFSENMEDIRVTHHEYETHVFYVTDGRCCANWYCSTGTCTIWDLDMLITRITDGIKNYFNNSHNDAMRKIEGDQS